MSTPQRKLTFYSIKLTKRRSRDHVYVDPKDLLPIFDHIEHLNDQGRTHVDESLHRLVKLDLIQRKDGGKRLLVRMTSAKYHHSPPLVHTNGSRRTSPKDLEEGEEELTHLALQVMKDEIIMVHETRQSGVPIQGFVGYLRYHVHEMFKQRNEQPPFTIRLAIIPKGDFKDELKKLTRVKAGTVYVTKEILGSPGLKFSNRTAEVKEEIVLSIFTKRDRDMSPLASDLFRVFSSSGSKITKMRIEGEEHGKLRFLATDLVKKIEHAEVKISSITGQVDTDDIFSHLETFLDSLDE